MVLGYPTAAGALYAGPPQRKLAVAQARFCGRAYVMNCCFLSVPFYSFQRLREVSLPHQKAAVYIDRRARKVGPEAACEEIDRARDIFGRTEPPNQHGRWIIAPPRHFRFDKSRAYSIGRDAVLRAKPCIGLCKTDCPCLGCGIIRAVL